VLSITSTLATQLKTIVTTGKFNLITNTTVLVSTTSNVIAESKDGLDNGTVIVIGSHLDSVPAGPGLNDNGSGSSTILAIAIEFAKWVAPANKVRFAWWGAEELGLFGSAAYVQSLKNASQLDKVALNLNFDMIASPNFIRGVYNGSSGKDDIREASIVIQKLFENHFHSVGLPFKLSDFNGRSDYGPFIENGIPAGGLDTGAEEKKTEAERKIFGGMANTPYDPCYHLSCDTIDNISEKALGDMSTAAAAVLEKLATEKDLLKLLYPKGKSEQTIPSERTQTKRRGSYYYL
jgi:Zn-dependent M28 family amino/carboxypeptidase